MFNLRKRMMILFLVLSSTITWRLPSNKEFEVTHLKAKILRNKKQSKLERELLSLDYTYALKTYDNESIATKSWQRSSNNELVCLVEQSWTTVNNVLIMRQRKFSL